MSKEIPVIRVTGSILVITISAEELKQIAERRTDWEYSVSDPVMFLNHFAANLEEYFGPNDAEKGMTSLQSLFDEVIDHTYENGSEAIQSPHN